MPSGTLYLHSLNDQNLRHIRDGGITVPDMALYRKGNLAEAYARGTTVKLTPSQVRSITAGMTAQERAFARRAHDYYNGMSREAINQVSEKLKGYSLAQVENYFPIQTDTSFTKSDFESIKFDGSIEGMGFLKERVNAANPILLRDVDAVVEQSIRQHGKYVGMAVPVRNFNKIWGVTTGSFNEDGSRNVDPISRKLLRQLQICADLVQRHIASQDTGQEDLRDLWHTLVEFLRGKSPGRNRYGQINSSLLQPFCIKFVYRIHM